MSSKASTYSTSNTSKKSYSDLPSIQNKIDSLIPHYNKHNETNVMNGIKKIKNK